MLNQSNVWGLLYTHHLVPDRVLAQSLATIRAMGLPDEQLVISCHRPDARLPDRARKVFHKSDNANWIPAIYSQMIAGLSLIPGGDRVLTLEHDVFYPVTYLDQMSAAMTEAGSVYYYTLLRHLDLRDGQRTEFWASDSNGTRTLQSCAGGYVDTLMGFARADLEAYNAGKLDKAFELGMGGGGSWRRVDGDQPVLDVRHGANTTSTGYEKEAYFIEYKNAYWGYAHQLRKRLM
ncbi:hypothetical protein [Spirosoma fluviale]|uniref:Glycosyl transferase family 2 n=1 Tax=Spirosoma fluviale TaxID=1597977 RepID=A0A286FD67_9BACT|nr:hypothetical protein [Spirosoma fluviale]SOD81046.1 hypothetical protein SAMN06269250_1656 [Spirosoma fluviale]